MRIALLPCASGWMASSHMPKGTKLTLSEDLSFWQLSTYSQHCPDCLSTQAHYQDLYIVHTRSVALSRRVDPTDGVRTPQQGTHT